MWILWRVIDNQAIANQRKSTSATWTVKPVDHLLSYLETINLMSTFLSTFCASLGIKGRCNCGLES